MLLWGVLSEARRDHLVLWLENRWSLQSEETRAVLLSMPPRVRGLAAGHEALGGLEEHECANAIEVVERFYRDKLEGHWRNGRSAMKEELRPVSAEKAE